MNYYKLSHEAIAVAADIPDMVLLLEQFTTSPGDLCTAIDLANTFVSISVNKV